MKVQIIKHIDIEGPGTIGEFLNDDGISYDVIDVFNGEALPDSLSDTSAVIVLGGPMNVYEEDKHPFLKQENEYLKEVIENKLPALGFCLGAQLIAKATGASVKKNPQKEIGWFNVSLTESGFGDPLFQGFHGVFDVFQWHGDTFDIPDGAVRLAESDLCPNQAYRVGSNIYGLQFHVEVTDEMIYQWIDAYRDEVDSLKGIVDPDRIIADTKIKSESYKAQARLFCSNFVKMI
ncbi:GMP synthase [Candidatus Scalindua japonica]|uniref:GMP synthase n=1 Tax=Candidatus Scalindua japonica TaxID=1284222 RepID=A0A286U3S5_9BACT|nr:type 1 glutamine amidotransferase [Candidatus Scalindua japonica]GAX62783.1 GMP synthase [Candidatus Scalindua japonica]